MVRLTFSIKQESTLGDKDMDASLFEMINNLAGKIPWLDVVMILSAKYLPVLFAIVLVIFYLSFQANQQRIAVLAGISTLVALGIAQSIAFLDPRPRPYLTHVVHLLIERSNDPSFPSDHATLSFAIATMIWLYNRKVGGILLGLAALVGFSRVYVGTHYPMDVVGGAALGMAVSLITDHISKQHKIRTLLDKFFRVLSEWHLAGKPE
jgi:undecaprenyl-diphosphatase